ncbi:hypothetical protein B0H10DRAFT_2206385 [Mycena sp. CBHHK59/15]|nr:hypothetical protein B0H10DRAFT_2206385 [Mycena sp. CBHHK59/15]
MILKWQFDLKRWRAIIVKSGKYTLGYKSVLKQMRSGKALCTSTQYYPQFPPRKHAVDSAYGPAASYISGSSTRTTSRKRCTPIVQATCISALPFCVPRPSTPQSSLPTSTHPNLHYRPAFTQYLAREAGPRCGRLKLCNWLLTIVQRCPHHLLIKDFIACTSPDNTLSLLTLQCATPSLPFQLIIPGHAHLLAVLRDREFLLFSDCVVWLEVEYGDNRSSVHPSMVCTLSKSETELRTVRSGSGGGGSGGSGESVLPPMCKSAYHHPVSRMKWQQHSSSGTMEEGRWVYTGRMELVDLEVVVTSREVREERRFEVLSPQGSFVLYADSEEEHDTWMTAIRQTKAWLFDSLNPTPPRLNADVVLLYDAPPVLAARFSVPALR